MSHPDVEFVVQQPAGPALTVEQDGGISLTIEQHHQVVELDLAVPGIQGSPGARGEQGPAGPEGGAFSPSGYVLYTAGVDAGYPRWGGTHRRPELNPQDRAGRGACDGKPRAVSESRGWM
ncbi:hypothetical protein ABZ297_22380 [Nonomuraea sp. NPDC005983]|uniref:hypothetical protein n=1 Tax=Nonomuraea sp. NPDC005983 TaxID=3155595 RepID=UPI0033ACD1D9